MERIGAVLEREEELLEVLLFKLVETRLLLEAGETRFLARATREVERARTRAREVDLVRAATVAQRSPGATLRELASSAPEPWPGILRDHHELLTSLVAEIEVTAHRNSGEARHGLEVLHTTPLAVSVPGASRRPGLTGEPELERLSQGAAYEAVLGTASKLRMPDLLDFLR